MKKYQKLLTNFIPWLIPFLILCLWQILSSAGVISTNILPAPITVFKTALSLSKSGELTKNITISLYRATVGFLIGGCLGFFFGLINGLLKIANLLFDSTIQMVRNIPHLALIPLVISWFGIGELAKIFLVIVGVFFPVYINTYHGIKSADKDLIEMGKIYDLSPRKLFTNIIFPSALPSILVGSAMRLVSCGQL